MAMIWFRALLLEIPTCVRAAKELCCFDRFDTRNSVGLLKLRPSVDSEFQQPKQQQPGPKVQQSARCMEIPLVVKWSFDPSSVAIWFSNSTVAPKACAREAGHWTAAAHPAHREPNTGRS